MGRPSEVGDFDGNFDFDFDVFELDDDEDSRSRSPLAAIGIDDPEPHLGERVRVVVELEPGPCCGERTVAVQATYDRTAMERREALLAACLVLVEDLRGGPSNAPATR